MTIAFFPGKFQPPHIGHVLTLSKLLKRYDIIIGISPDEPRVVSQQVVKETFETIFDDKIQYFIFDKVLSNYQNISFLPKFDVLLTGNEKIIEWAKKLEIPVEKIPRSKCIGSSGSELRGLCEKNG